MSQITILRIGCAAFHLAVAIDRDAACSDGGGDDDRDPEFLNVATKEFQQVARVDGEVESWSTRTAVPKSWWR